MSDEWIDVTVPMRPGMTVWPGDAGFRFEPTVRMAAGAPYNLSTLTLSAHTGTHCDAPWHFLDGGKKLDELDAAVFFGRALLLDFRGLESIRAVDLPGTPLPPRVLFRTRNSDRPANAPFDTGYVGIETDAAARMVADGVRMVGFDGPSVGPYRCVEETHNILLGADVFIVENLRLAQCEAGEYECIVLPMRLVGADGAPCRAFMRRIS
jgi:arylformamidase